MSDTTNLSIQINRNLNISLFEAMVASERIWENAVRTNTVEMSIEDINAEIEASRKERRARVSKI